MLIAHLPAGYCLARLGQKHIYTWPILPTVMGSIVPDLDMLWFYLVDSSIHHHKLPPHLPIYWFVGLAFVALVLWLTQHKSGLLYLAGFTAGLFLHLILDSLFAPIWWLYPLIDQPLELFQIPATQNHWILSFVLHRSFLLELAIVITALWLWLTRKSSTLENRS